MDERYDNSIEIISMKAILKYNVDKDAKEAEMGLKKGMTLGCRTSLTWHLYGIFRRSQKYKPGKRLLSIGIIPTQRKRSNLPIVWTPLTSKF